MKNTSKKRIWPKPISTQTPRPSTSLYAQEVQILCSFCLVKLKTLVPISQGFEEEFVFLSLLPSGFYFFSLSLFESMESLSRLNNCHQSLHHLSLNHHRPSVPKPISSHFLTTPPSLLTTRAWEPLPHWTHFSKTPKTLRKINNE